MDPVACRVVPAADLPSELPDPSTIEGLVAFDTETSALHPDPPEYGRVSVVSLAWYDPDLDAIVAGAYPFGQGIGGDRADLGPHQWNILCRWLAEAGGGLVGHNSKFDIVMMNAGSVDGYPGIDLNDRIAWDTMIAAREMWPQTPAALKSLAVLMFDEDADAEQQALAPHLGPKRDPRFDRVPWEVMEPYAVQDSVLTLRLLHKQADLVAEGLEGTRYLGQEIEISKALTRMEFAGIPYDPEISRAQGEILQREIDRLSAELPFHPTLPKAKVYFFGSEPQADLGRGVVECQCRVPYSLTEKGQPSLDAETLDQMVRESVPYAAEYQTIQRYKSAVSKWYSPFADRCGADGRLRTQFRQVASGAGDVGGTKSGRFSAGRINLQAVPKDYALHLPVMTPRQVIGAAADALDGWALWELDLAQAELRTAALDAGCTKMLDLIVAGEDTHGATATELFGTRPGDPEFQVHRQIAKRALPLDAPVLTPQGFRPMGDIQVGDMVVGPDGASTRVLAIPFEGEGEIWEVRTRSGATALCDADHLWNVRRRYGEGYETITTRQLADEVASNRKRRPALPLFLDENIPDRDFPVHPYVLGALLGDGSVPDSGQGAPKLHSLKSDRYIADRCGELSGDTVREATRKDRPEMGRYHFLGNGIRTGFRELGILGVRGKDKRVPEEYFHGSAEQRLELLRGLMDTDGSATKNNRHIFNNTSRGLVDAVVRLVRSLGGVATVNEAYRPPYKEWSPAWFVHIRMPEGRNPYSLPRKSDRWKPNQWTDAVVHAAPTGRREPVKCITVDRPDGLFVTNDYLVTHNCNFSLIFGSGVKTFRAMIHKEAGQDMSESEVARIVYGWRDLYPEFGRRIDYCMDHVDRTGYVELTNGKRRYYHKREDSHSAFNQRIQGSLAEYAKAWLLQTDRYLGHLPRLGLDAGIGRAGLILVVHDSQVLLVPDDSEGEAMVQKICADAEALWDEWFNRNGEGVPGGVDAERW